MHDISIMQTVLAAMVASAADACWAVRVGTLWLCLVGCGDDCSPGRNVLYFNANDGSLHRATMPGGLDDAEDLGVAADIRAVALGGDLAVAGNWLVGGDGPVPIPGVFAGFDADGSRIIGTSDSPDRAFLMDTSGAVRTIHEGRGTPSSIAAGRVALSTFELAGNGATLARGAIVIDLASGNVLFDRAGSASGFYDTVLSPDGRWLAWSDETLKTVATVVVPLDGGAESTHAGCVPVPAEGRDFAWPLGGGERFPGAPFSPQSDSILLLCDNDLVRFGLGHGTETVLASPGGPARYVGDGSLLYLVTGRDAVSDGEAVFDDVWVIPPGGLPERRWADRRFRTLAGVSADGRYALFASWDVVESGDVAGFSGRRLESLDLSNATLDVLSEEPADAFGAVFAPDGRTVHYLRRRYDSTARFAAWARVDGCGQGESALGTPQSSANPWQAMFAPDR